MLNPSSMILYSQEQKEIYSKMIENKYWIMSHEGNYSIHLPVENLYLFGDQ